VTHRTIIFSLVAIIAAVYPFLIYFGLNAYGIKPLAILLLVVSGLRIILWQQFKRTEKIILVSLLTLLCGLAILLNSQALLRFYPVLMNIGFSAVFLLSLRTKQPLIERIMSAMIKDLSIAARRYLRGLTLAWGLLLLFNALISFYTACCLSFHVWTIYNGFLVYIVFGVFTLIELIYRSFYKKRHPE